MTCDYQRVKLTELDDGGVHTDTDTHTQQSQHMENQHPSSGSETASSHASGNSASASASAARVPRTIEVEVRESLVNTCVPGDLLCVVGIVKTVQVCTVHWALHVGTVSKSIKITLCELWWVNSNNKYLIFYSSNSYSYFCEYFCEQIISNV